MLRAAVTLALLLVAFESRAQTAVEAMAYLVYAVSEAPGKTLLERNPKLVKYRLEAGQRPTFTFEETGPCKFHFSNKNEAGEEIVGTFDVTGARWDQIGQAHRQMLDGSQGGLLAVIPGIRYCHVSGWLNNGDYPGLKAGECRDEGRFLVWQNNVLPAVTILRKICPGRAF